MSLACLDTLVGLSADSNNCYTDSAPTGFDTSDSGYYLTDKDFGLSAMNGASVPGWAILSAARAQAIREFKTDLLAAIRTRLDSAVHPFSGYIGELKATGLRTATGDFIGQRIRTRRQKGLRIVLEKCFLGLDTSGVYTVEINSNDPLFEAPDPLEVTHTANTFNGTQWPAGGISLPLWSDSSKDDYLEYYIAFDRNGATPLNNKLYCCGHEPGWKKHLDITGFSADSIAPETGGSFSTSGNGMVLKAHLTCENLDWLCELNELNGYHTLDVVARTIQARAAAIAATDLVDRVPVSVGAGFDEGQLIDQKNVLNGRYSENIKWISQNIPKGVTDCFKCKPEAVFSKRKLLI